MRVLALGGVAVGLSVLMACESDEKTEDTGGGGTAIAEVTVDQTAMLAAHNGVRRPLALSDLQWDDTLAANSLSWSRTLAADGCGLYHSAAETYGENLYWTSATSTDQEVVDAWASEVAYYDYDSNTCADGEQCGHYTQIVWDSTERVGCGAATCPDGGGEVWTCRYDPPGNWVGEQPY